MIPLKYNISKNEGKRPTEQKVRAVGAVEFFVDTHGIALHWWLHLNNPVLGYWHQNPRMQHEP